MAAFAANIYLSRAHPGHVLKYLSHFMKIARVFFVRNVILDTIRQMRQNKEGYQRIFRRVIGILYKNENRNLF